MIGRQAQAEEDWGTAAWPLAARARQPERMRRIGVIVQMAEKDPQAQLNVLAFQKGLHESTSTWRGAPLGARSAAFVRST